MIKKHVPDNVEYIVVGIVVDANVDVEEYSVGILDVSFVDITVLGDCVTVE